MLQKTLKNINSAVSWNFTWHEIFFSLVTPFGVLIGLVVTAKISEVTPACLEEDSFAPLKYFLMHLMHFLSGWWLPHADCGSVARHCCWVTFARHFLWGDIYLTIIIITNIIIIILLCMSFSMRGYLPYDYHHYRYYHYLTLHVNFYEVISI